MFGRRKHDDADDTAVANLGGPDEPTLAERAAMGRALARDELKQAQRAESDDPDRPT